MTDDLNALRRRAGLNEGSQDPALDQLLDQVHRALRGVDASDTSVPLPDSEVNLCVDAVQVLEQFCRSRGIKLSEFAR